MVGMRRDGLMLLLVLLARVCARSTDNISIQATPPSVKTVSPTPG